VNPILETALEVQRFCRSRHWRFCFIGAIAVQRRVVLLEGASGVPIDVSLGGIPFEERVVERSSPWDIGGAEPLATCSAEDLVVLKAFAGRDKDWLDIEGVVVRQRDRLKTALVLWELRPLLELKEDARSLARLRAILDRVASES
jgi:hypothetical protein